MGKDTRERRNDPAQVWREGNRIRRGDSTGYADSVPDDTIWKHLADDAEKRDMDAVIFCASVLRLRAEMRALAAHRAILDSIDDVTRAGE